MANLEALVPWVAFDELAEPFAFPAGIEPSLVLVRPVSAEWEPPFVVHL